MDSKIYVGSIDTLENLERLLGVFADRASDSLEAFGRESERRMSAIDNYCADCQRELVQWESDYESADDEEDDIGYLAFKRDEAQEKLAQANHWQRRIEESNETFVRSARRVMAISTERLVEARSFLIQKCRELNEYTGMSPDDISFGSNREGGQNSGSRSNDVWSPVTLPSDAEVEANTAELETSPGNVRSKFATDFGKFAHQRYQTKLREFEKLGGREEGKDFGIEYGVKHPDGHYVYYDYVDFNYHVIIDYKSAEAGQTEHDLADKHSGQRERHIEAYQAKYGVTPTYRYETYSSMVNLYAGKGASSSKSGAKS